MRLLQGWGHSRARCPPVGPVAMRRAEVRLGGGQKRIDAQHANLQRPPVHTARGVGIYVQTTAKTDDEARVLLSALRFPFLKYK